MQEPFSFVFIGRSGCGKGTQVSLLSDYLKEKYGSHSIFYLEAGKRFRDFIQGDSFSSKLSEKIYNAGERQPDFLAIWVWSHILVESFTGTEHLIIDGSPRALGEAAAMMTAMKFYGRKPFIVYIDVSRTWSEEKLLARGRFDDVDQNKVKRRLDWFESDVMPAVEYFEDHPEVTFVRVNGEQSIEDVFKDLINQIRI
jgi:adenylate kinase family enzyme